MMDSPFILFHEEVIFLAIATFGLLIKDQGLPLDFCKSALWKSVVPVALAVGWEGKSRLYPQP